VVPQKTGIREFTTQVLTFKAQANQRWKAQVLRTRPNEDMKM